MKLFLDSSALAKLWLQEEHSEAVRGEFQRAEARCASVLALVEVRSTLGRVRRERRLSLEWLAKIEAAAMLDFESITTIDVDAGLATDAGILAAAHGIKSLDALHLATALALVADQPDEGWTFVTYDNQLATAASFERLAVWPPGPRKTKSKTP